MSTAVFIKRVDGTNLSSVADAALQFAARFWFLVAVAGQWVFAAYVVAFYGGAAARGDREAWNEVISGGYTAGHTMSNFAVAAHLLLAVVIMIGGPLQLIPTIRRRAPVFHRWTGRLYIPAVFLTSLAGLYMVWSRGRSGRLVQSIGVSFDALLIMGFALLALRYALARDFGAHRRWALRLFMVVNAGWFFRVGLMLWVFVNQGPVGFDPKTFTGPFINFLSFADYLLPLLLLEVYLRAKESAGVSGRLALTAALLILTVAMGAGIFAASMVMWLPRI